MRVDEDDELIGYKAVYNNDRDLSRSDPNGFEDISSCFVFFKSK
jgi:hypothetical protein